MPYRVEIKESAAEEIRKLERGIRNRVLAKLEQLADDPRPSGVKKLRSNEGLYRVRVGDYRIVYKISDAELLVLIVRVADRKDVYD